MATTAQALRDSAEGVDIDVMNLAETTIDICDGRALDRYSADTRRAVDRIATAAAVLIAAPVYRASFPGVLKNLLDIAPVEALQAKPVGIVAMGGSAHHYLAVDTQLRQVLGWFGALVAPTAVYLTGADFRDGQLIPGSASADLIALAKRCWHCCASIRPSSVRSRWPRNSPEGVRRRSPLDLIKPI